MCWSFGASAVFCGLGLVTAAYLILKKDKPGLWVSVIYFSIMELLQALTYRYIDDCASPANQLLTYLGILHICFQPFFINMFSMCFIPEKVMKKIYGFVYTVCFLGTIYMLVKIYPFDWAGQCLPHHETLCGSNLCSISGSWHLSWKMPMNDIARIEWGYFVPGFFVPLIYGAWAMTLVHFLLGPYLALFLSDPANSLIEFPAIWCLFSIGMILIVFTRPVYRLLEAKKWYFWKYPFIDQKNKEN